VTDPIADMLTRIRNAIMVRHDSAQVPASKIKLAIAKILKEEGFITNYEVVKGKPHRMIKVQLRYLENNKPAISGMKRISKPGLRMYVHKREIPRVYFYLAGAKDGAASLAPKVRRRGIMLRMVNNFWSDMYV
jgi:small subunit ribosomal protein S8